MPDGLMKQNTGTTRSHHNRHFTSFGFHRFKEDRRPRYGFLRNKINNIIRQKLEAHAISTSRISIFYLSVLLHNADSPKSHHRPIVVIHHSFGIAE